MKFDFHHIGLTANPTKTDFRSVVENANKLVLRSGRKSYADPETAALANLKGVSISKNISSLARKCDLLLVFGGDGTILNVARSIHGQAPLFGINTGQLGFLTSGGSNHLEACLKALWKGKCSMESRALIEARSNEFSHNERLLAMNDFVITRGEVFRMIKNEVRVDGELILRFRGDGLIISSPTGSTAYSLAAGGAIVSPKADVMILTPICPHSLVNRPVIVGKDSIIDIKLLSPSPKAILSCDGQEQRSLVEGQTITVKTSRTKVNLIWLEGSSFWRTLREKLDWTDTPV